MIAKPTFCALMSSWAFIFPCCLSQWLSYLSLTCCLDSASYMLNVHGSRFGSATPCDSSLPFLLSFLNVCVLFILGVLSFTFLLERAVYQLMTRLLCGIVWTNNTIGQWRTHTDLDTQSGKWIFCLYCLLYSSWNYLYSLCISHASVSHNDWIGGKKRRKESDDIKATCSSNIAPFLHSGVPDPFYILYCTFSKANK